MSVEDLKGVGKQTWEKLKSAGITSIEALAVLGSKELSSLTGLEEAKALNLIQQARSHLGIKIETADQILERRLTILRITTGSRNLDEILGGGVETQAITELVGPYGSGKSQLCHQLAVNVQLPLGQGGLAQPDKPKPAALFIDTEGTFRPERVKQMAEAKGLDPSSPTGWSYAYIE